MALALVPVSRIIFTFFVPPVVALTMFRLSLYSFDGTSVLAVDKSSGEDNPKHKGPRIQTKRATMPTATVSWSEEQRLYVRVSPAPEFQCLIPIFMSSSSGGLRGEGDLGLRGWLPQCMNSPL